MPKFDKALLLPFLHPLEGCQLGTFPESFFPDPSLQFFLPVNVHVNIVVHISCDACIDQCRDEKSHRGCCIAVYFEIECF